MTNTCNPKVKVTLCGKTPSSSTELHMTLDKCTEVLVGRLPTESVLLMRNFVLDGEAYEYLSKQVHITVEPLIHADS